MSGTIPEPPPTSWSGSGSAAVQVKYPPIGPRSYSIASSGVASVVLTVERIDKGGHFAAWEQPTLLSQELRMAFRSLR